MIAKSGRSQGSANSMLQSWSRTANSFERHLAMGVQSVRMAGVRVEEEGEVYKDVQ